MNMSPPDILKHPKIITDFSILSGKILIFGGSFDPIQKAHIDLAEQVKDALSLDYVVFMPAYQNPLKAHAPVPGLIRTEMILKGIESIDGFLVSPLEINRGEDTGQSSYAIDTVTTIDEQLTANSSLYFLIGGDNVKDLHRWADIHSLLEKVQLVTVPRRKDHTKDSIAAQATGLSEDEIDSIVSHFVDIETLPISSTQVRDTVADGKSPEELVPEGVDELIEYYQLYQN